MGDRVTDLRCKEVINISDGAAAGICVGCGAAAAGGKSGCVDCPRAKPLFGAGGCKDDFVIPWNCIKRIGEDIILAELEPEKCRKPRPKHPLF